MKFMIFRYLMLLVLFFLSNNFNTQILDYREANIGFFSGLNYSKVENAHNPSSARKSFLVGAFALIPFYTECRCDKKKFVQLQLEYNQLGEKGRKKTLYATNYASLLLMYRFYFHYNKNNSFFINTGPKFSILLKQKVVNPPLGRPYSIEEDGKANPFDYGLLIMGGININEKLDLFLRGDYSFSNQYPYLNEYPTTGDPLAAKRKAQFSISAGVGINILTNTN